MAAVPTLETPRLLLRPVTLEDAPAVQAVFPQWEVVEFLASTVPWPYPPDGALTFIRDRVLPAMAAGQQWVWSIRPRSVPEQLIGIINLTDGEDNHRGFWLAPDWQGRGLMTEACIAVNDFWFDTLGKPVMRIPKAVDNVRSRRISERMGMRVITTREQDFVCGRRLTEVWEITRDEWQAWRAANPQT